MIKEERRPKRNMGQLAATIAAAFVAVAAGGGGLFTGAQGNTRSLKNEERLGAMEAHNAAIEEDVKHLIRDMEKVDAKLDRVLTRK